MNLMHRAAIAGTFAWGAWVAGCSGSADTSGPPPVGSGTVQGQVTDGNAGLAGVGLSLARSGQATRNATTGADGRFSFTQVPTGSWLLTATPPTGYTVAGSAAVQVNVTDGQAATQNFTVGQAAADSSVSVVDFYFTPADVSVKVGTTVTFTNNGSATHTVTANAGGFDSGNLAAGGTFKHTFATAGTFAYHCAIHPAMVGTITVH